MQEEHNVEGIVENVDDFAFEEDLARDRYSVKKWWQYIQTKKNATREARRAARPRTPAPSVTDGSPASLAAPQVRYKLFERALRVVPGSYKLWYNYLVDRKRAVRAAPPPGRSVDHVGACSRIDAARARFGRSASRMRGGRS